MPSGIVVCRLAEKVSCTVESDAELREIVKLFGQAEYGVRGQAAITGAQEGFGEPGLFVRDSQPINQQMRLPRRFRLTIFPGRAQRQLHSRSQINQMPG